MIMAAPLGSGGRFKVLVGKLKRKKNPPADPEAVAAMVGRKKYGKAAFQKMAAMGRRRS